MHMLAGVNHEQVRRATPSVESVRSASCCASFRADSTDSSGRHIQPVHRLYTRECSSSHDIGGSAMERCEILHISVHLHASCEVGIFKNSQGIFSIYNVFPPIRLDSLFSTFPVSHMRLLGKQQNPRQNIFKLHITGAAVSTRAIPSSIRCRHQFPP